MSDIKSILKERYLTGKREHFQKVPDSVLDDSDLNPSAIVVYLHLVRECGRRGGTEIGHRLLSRKSGLCHMTVNRSIQKLKDGGHIEITKGKQNRAVYTVTKK